MGAATAPGRVPHIWAGRAGRVIDRSPRSSTETTVHRYAEVLPICDVVYLLHQGRLLKLDGDVRGQLSDYGYLAS
ncbi:hypothetical protein GCM10028822_13690 [Hymenobacter terrigena]